MNCARQKEKSIEQRVRKIHVEYLFFAGCVSKIIMARPSGSSDDNVIHIAADFFNEVQISVISESCRQLCRFKRCWCLSKDQPKFYLLLNLPPPTSCENKIKGATSNEKEERDAKDKEEFKRQICPKRIKAMGAKTEVNAKKLKIVETSLAAQEGITSSLKSTKRAHFLLQSWTTAIKLCVNICKLNTVAPSED